MDQPVFTYEPCCAFSEEEPATFKVAAPWSYGSIRELKTYAICCEEHLERSLARARAEAANLVLAEGEVLGPIAVYRLLPGIRDAELTPVALPD